uniref:Little elongation complex subunit 1 C-terminal domain-containing protein n=1 Tax=Oreochromis aureus TaxID=47969 RepID=A0A668TNQ3_OREAU
MMPGENQSKALAIAADATTGNCQNCSVLQQTLAEYVSSFLALKQKIAVSDDTIRLQQQLEELQIRLVTLEKKTADYESVQAELEEKKSALKMYEQLSEEVEKLKVEKSKTIAENKKLEDQLKNVKDLADKQTLENAQLKREKAVVENDLLISQTSLQKSQAQAEQAEKLMDENAKMTSTKDHLESKIRILEDSVCQQKHQISQLTKEKTILEKNINDLQVRLMKLERERNKEYRSTTTQASAPAEPKIDKEKFRMLLENLWACVDPEQEESVNQLHFPESRVPPSSPQATLHSRSPRTQDAIKHKASLQCSGERKQAGTPKKSKRSPKARKTAESSTEMDTLSLEEIIRLFKPMPPSISPLPDLDTEVESMKMEVRENESHSKPCEDRPALKQEQTLHVATSPSSQRSPKSAALQTEGNADFSVVTDEGEGEISNEKDFEQTKFGGIPKVIDKIATDMRGIHPQNDMLIEQEPSSAQLSPPSSSFSTSSFTGLIEAVPLPTESTLLSCNPGISRISENENALEDANSDLSETVTSMDVDMSPSDITDNKTVAPDGGESALIGDSMEGIVVAATQNSSDIEKNTLDSFKLQDSTRSGCKDSDIPEHTPSSSGSSDSITAVSNEHLEEKLEVDESIKLLGKEDGNAQGTVAACPASSTCNNIPPPPSSPLLKKEDDQSDADQESGQANVEPLRKKDADIDIVTNFQETNTVNCESLKESAHSLCKQVSPSCLLPSIKLQALDSHPGKLNVDVNIDHVSTNKPIPFPNLEKECDIEKATVEDLPQHKIHTSSSTSLETMPDSPETNTVNCKAAKEDRHSLCSQLSPSCLLPTVKLVSLDTQPNPGILDADVQTEIISTNIQSPSFSLEEQGVTKSATNEDQAQDKMKGGDTTPLIQNPAAEGQDKSLDLQMVEPENLVREEKTTSGGSSAEAQAPECISNVRGEMGPPLPRLLTPLKTPPKINRSINPRQAIGKLLFPSPMDGIESPTSPTQTNRTPNRHQLSSLSTNSPLPLNGVPSSPLQFGSATPKHAVPVPGRLPLTAMSSSPSSSSATPSQENSMRFLDTMYPELSARARTLSILRGNVNLNICSSESGTLPTTDSQKSSFKTINSTSTAFTKTEVRGEKRPAIGMPQPKSSKCLRLDQAAGVTHNQVLTSSSKSADDTSSAQNLTLEQLKTETISSSLKSVEHPQKNLIVNSLRKIEDQCFDLLPVIRSHLHVGNLPKKPVLRDEEKEVIAEVCQSSSADDMTVAILNKLKAGKMDLSGNHVQALCRVYTGICRKRRDVEKARVLAYSLLIEDFPDSAKLILFMVTTWPNLLTHTSSLSQAIHAVTKLRAPEELLSCLLAFLGWNKTPPCDIDELISRTLSEIRSGSNLSFTKHSRYGEDLGAEAWEHVYALHLLCTNKKWKWTYDNLLGKELWPLMNSWVTRPQQQPISDVAVATVLRLIGCLGQLGLKEKCISTVVTIANVINTFGRHGPAEGVPWEVQLAAVYCIYDLSPCNPKQALEALAEWRGETSQSVPPAVTSCINQLACICRQANS